MITHLFIKRAATLLAAATLGSTLSIAANGDNPPGAPGQRILDQIHKHLVRLGITNQQRDQIREVLRAAMPEVKPLVQQSIHAHRALQACIRATPVDEAAIRAQSAKVAAIDADLAVKRAHPLMPRSWPQPEKLGQAE